MFGGPEFLLQKIDPQKPMRCVFCVTLSGYNRDKMSDFQTKMHQIHFPLGLGPTGPSGALTVLPSPPSCI